MAHSGHRRRHDNRGWDLSLAFCQQIDDAADEVGVASSDFPPWYTILGFSWQPMQDIQIALHVLILYLGTLTCSWLKTYQHARILHWEKEKRANNNGKSMRYSSSNNSMTQQLPIIPKPKYLRQSLLYTWIQPTIQSIQSFHNDEDHRWMILRNLGIAPLAEEVIFRACLLPPLLASRTANANEGTLLSPTAVSWVAPLFFGVAHLHHFYEKYRQLPSSRRSNNYKIVRQLLLVVVVQWTYTTLFGAYVSHVFVRTGSLSGVTLAHVICNYMGLPDVSFAHPTSKLYGYRWFISIVYLFGIGLFVWGFDSALFPRASVLPSLLLRGE